MLQESDAKPHGQASSSAPTTPLPTSSGSLNGASSNGATTSETTRRLDDLEENGQEIPNEQEVTKLLKQIFHAVLKKVPPKYRNIIGYSLAIISLVSSGGLGGSYLTFRLISPQPVSPTTFSTPLGRVNTSGYCKSLEYPQSHDEFCSSNVVLEKVCSVLYPGKTDLFFQYENSQDPYTGSCYNSQGTQTGALSLDHYCEVVSHKGSTPLAIFVNNTWVCQIKVDMVAACGWQKNSRDIQARKDKEAQWTCYGV